RWAEIAVALLVLALIIGGVFFFARRPTTSSLGVAENSIAVLPFVNMSDDKTNESFSDGISEELLNLLAKVPQLQVAARTSSFSFKGKGLEIPEIARQLHGGVGAPERRPLTDHRPAGARRRRLPSVVGNLRPQDG